MELSYIGNYSILTKNKNNMENLIIKIKDEFTDSPGARYIKDGEYSGEEFYNDFLFPRFEKALKNKIKLTIVLDGVWGYPSSFVSGSFGKLSLKFSAEEVLSVINFISEDSGTRKERIIYEIKNPTSK